MAKKDVSATPAPATDETAAATTPAPAAPSTAMATTDPYTTALTEARQGAGSRFQVLLAKSSETEAKDITAIGRSATPNTVGREEMDTKWTLPIIRVVQGMTRDKPANAQLGDLYTSTGRVLPPNFRFTPLYVFESNRMYSSDNKGAQCAAPDGKLGTTYGHCASCPHLPMGKNATGTNTDCDNGLNFVILGQDMKLYRLEFFKTSKKAGSKLDQQAADCEVYWGNWFILSSQSTKNDKGEYYISKVTASGESVPAHLREASAILHDLIRAERIAAMKAHYDSFKKGTQKLESMEEGVDVPGGTSGNPTEDVSAGM